MFETTSILDSEMLKKIATNHMVPWKKYLLYGIGALCTIFIFVGIIDHDILGAIISGAAAGIVAYSLFVKPSRWMETQANAILGSGVKSFEYASSFGDNAVSIENKTTGWSGTIPYENFSFLYDIGEAYVLFTAGGQYVIVNKAQLGPEKCEKFIHFLQHHLTGIRWKRVRLKG